MTTWCQNHRLARRLLRIAFCLAVLAPSASLAEVIDILRGDPANPIVVPLGGSVVVGTDKYLVENVIANPGIADPSMISQHALRLSGKRIGRTTLSVIDRSGAMISAAVLVQDGLAVVPSDPVSLPAPGAVQTIDVVDGQAAEVIEIPMDAAVVITSDDAFSDITFGYNGVAYGALVFDRTAYLIGMEEGMTDVTLVRTEGMPNTRVSVAVVANMTGMD
jgi:Flp pilus assembly secretin CpaC